jgi:hypothetical protein
LIAKERNSRKLKRKENRPFEIIQAQPENWKEIERKTKIGGWLPARLITVHPI